MIDNDQISIVNRITYVVFVLALVVVYLDVTVWRP